MIDKELENYYSKYFEMFSSDGWKQFIDDLVGNVEVINSVEATKDPNDLFFRKGQLNILSFVINLEQSFNSSFEEINKDVQDI